MTESIHVIVRYGSVEMVGVVAGRDGDLAVVLVDPVDGDSFTDRWLASELRPATALDIYEHGEQVLQRRHLGPSYGRDEGRTLWDLMGEREREYWRALRPEGDT